ncbi:endonuclease MutS2 [Alicyclobacillus sp. SO9]|uniref:endonuclease MutS2 n=1 Tax=Alicyclobacillus sp. SO9 TaxID=2665646 RepID=UPI0018E83E35|nr:endonuclease MutS2 [Alicyclobacillus sp. SO9]QQE81357.1 endonuclease MutS2 [Alicyclobacillus sp. SO9]
MAEDRHAHAIKILELNKVRAQISRYAASSLGKELVADIAPLSALSDARRELDAVDEALRETFRMGPLPFGGISDVRPSLRKAAIGGVLSPQALLALANFLYGGRRVRQAVLSVDETIEYPILREQADLIYDARQVEQELRKAISDEATVHDGASPTLRQLRSQRRQAEAKVRQTLEQMLRSHQKMLQEPVITVRGNSLCLPVRVEHKNQIRGIIHDYSASGATVFIEPAAAVEISHRVQEILLEEEREVERILQQLSALVAGVSDQLETNAEVLARLDLWFAKAQYAKAEHCEKPVLTTNRVWKLRSARHPLINRDEAVPLDLTIGESYSMVVVTGPNTGGKTVALKTIGLLTLLAMAGCFVPAANGSLIGWCDTVYADIGDEQSIEQSLSTFSSHMRNIVSMLERVSDTSLVLLDELGAGTDPAEGAALAIAILNDLHVRGCSVMATTHYAELKAYAFQTNHAVNASVEFDVETLRPTYRLLVGVPGRSNALAIAHRLGLPESVIDDARGQLNTRDVHVEDLIRKMEAAYREADTARMEAEADRATADKLLRESQDRWQELQDKERVLLQDAATEAQEILSRAKTEANRIITELRKEHRNGQLKDHQLVEMRKALEEAMPDLPRAKARTGQAGQTGALEPGAIVRVLSVGQKGEVLEISPNRRDVVVQLGALKTKVKTSDLEVLERPKSTQPKVSVSRGTFARSIPLQLDVRGMSVEEAIPVVDKYLDDAVVSHMGRVTIIHGKGTGVLRDGVRKHLSSQKQVSSWSSGGPGEGGDGATVIDVAL